MSKESYIASVRPRINEIIARREKASAAAMIVGRLVKNYAYYSQERGGHPLQTPEIAWDNTAPDDLVWMELYDRHGKSIKEAPGNDPQNARYHVERADFIFGPDDTIFGTVFSVSLNPPMVTGLEGMQLEAPQIEKVITDLTHYENALHASATGQPS